MNCRCGRAAVVRTSWSDTNPGRRFWGCPIDGSKCPFIGWYEPALCARAAIIIPGLLRSKNRVEKELAGAKLYKILFYISWVIFALIFFSMGDCESEE